MQIGLDFRTIKWSQGTGVHRYRDRLRHIVTTKLESAETVLLLRDQAGDDDDGQTGQRTQSVVRADIYRKAQRRFRITGKITQVELCIGLDIFHWSHPLPLRINDCRNIYTVHDIIPVTHPELSAIDPRRFTRLIRALTATDAVFTAVSHDSAGAFVNWTGIDPGRVICTHQWVPEFSGKEPALSKIVKAPYFLMLGRVEPRKNIERMIAAWQKADTGVPLIIAGPDGHWAGKRDSARIGSMMETPGIIRMGWVDNQTAGALISGCRALFMPSLAEGFGLPMAEAMVAGVPVIAAKSSISEEIGGGAAILADPADIGDLAMAVRRVHDDNALRQRTIEHGKRAAQRFNAKHFTANLNNAYQHFL